MNSMWLTFFNDVSEQNDWDYCLKGLSRIIHSILQTLVRHYTNTIYVVRKVSLLFAGFRFLHNHSKQTTNGIKKSFIIQFTDDWNLHQSTTAPLSKLIANDVLSCSLVKSDHWTSRRTSVNMDRLQLIINHTSQRSMQNGLSRNYNATTLKKATIPVTQQPRRRVMIEY